MSYDLEDCILGVDPGVSGGLVLIDKKGLVVFKWIMPVMEEQKGKKTVDLGELREIFDECKNIKHVFIEKVSAMPGQGVSSMFKFGRAYGMIEAMVSAFQLPYTLVTPQRWTKVMHKDLDKSMKAKKRSELAFRRQYPKEDLRPSKACRKHHEGMIDALLIAEYGRREIYLKK